MNTRCSTAPVIIAVLGTVLLLAACTDPRPTSPTTGPLTATSTPTATSVGAPKTSDEAWIEANQTIGRFAHAQYKIERDGGANPERIEPFASGDALTSTRKIASDLRERGLRITGGTPGWEPNPSVSSFGDVTTAAGLTIANGIVYARGCWDLSKQSTLASSGTPPTDRTIKRFPLQFTVTYFSNAKTWLVTKQTNITDQPGAPDC